jgi:hypothetical protein
VSGPLSLIPGLGIARGMALTLRRFFEPKATIRYPEVPANISPRFRGRLQLLYDEYGTLKCETCFQCAQACPIECIDMGGIDTKGRFHVHWGPPETYGERREESALRRAGRTVPDPSYAHFEGIDPEPVDVILEDVDYDPKRMLEILERTQAAYGYLPVAALKRISFGTGAYYAFIYGTATYYRHLRFERPADHAAVAEATARRPTETAFLASLETSLRHSAPSRATAARSPAASNASATTKRQGGARPPRRPRRPN